MNARGSSGQYILGIFCGQNLTTFVAVCRALGLVNHRVKNVSKSPAWRHLKKQEKKNVQKSFALVVDILNSSISVLWTPVFHILLK